jgi:hypothetical protein
LASNPGPPADRRPDPYASLQREADRVRDAAKWLIASLGAVATVLVAGLQFSSIGAVPAGWRTVAAIAGAGTAIFALVFLIGLVLDVLLPSDVTIDKLVRESPGQGLRGMLEQNPSWLQGYDLNDLEEKYRQARLDRKDASDRLQGLLVATPRESTDQIALAQATYRIVDEYLQYLNRLVGFVMKAVAVQQLRARFDWWRRGLALAAAALIGLGIGAYAWGTNPPQPTPATVALRGVTLAGADLRGANLTNVDLTGSSLAQAKLAGVTWSNTTCPDGSNSDTHGKTCVGHLTPAP